MDESTLLNTKSAKTAPFTLSSTSKLWLRGTLLCSLSRPFWRCLSFSTFYSVSHHSHFFSVSESATRRRLPKHLDCLGCSFRMEDWDRLTLTIITKTFSSILAHRACTSRTTLTHPLRTCTCTPARSLMCMFSPT
ncbi:hypothetical protein BLNAU_1435 [Blattamonas nauphoetae]|uniref:Uncharacterized protein n=1 Tax=Blattamonas nauphoetae TaxID=2049346 RepID=A0ABQ9YIH5_9EUKA|nr:hypothetical protein BLNAU_1435 [Blattamonas nauphoetae]